jgi:lysophospholipase L1-like esterase
VRYTVFHNRSSKGLYSPGGTTYRYRYSIPEGVRDSITPGGDTVKIKVPGQSFGNASVFLKLHRGYSIARLWYGKAVDPAELKVYDSKSNDLLAEVTLDSDEPFNVLKLPLKTNATSLKCVFTGPSPEIYGFSFDPASGIQFDNYGLRGHSGDGIMNISQGLLRAEYVKLNNKLVILQYGGNVTPYVKNEASLNNIKKIYDKLYHYVKEANPEASVLVIGVNDVARNVGGTYASYPMVGKIRDAQKEVALKNGCAFFDLLELMGGENSVMAWYKKGWASRDGHYSDKGREIVVNELFMALMGEYNKFLMRGSTAGK